MLFRATVRTTALTLLTDAIIQAGAQTASSKDTAVPSGKTPSVIVYTDDIKEGNGGSPPQFRTNVLTTVEVVAEGKTKDEAEALCDTLCETVENTLLGTPAFVRLFEGIDSVETRTDYRATDSRLHVFTAVIEIKAHVSEIFEPVIEQVFSGLNVYIDSVNVFDANGSYTPPFDYPVAPAPRESGPDGRAEISGSIDTP